MGIGEDLVEILNGKMPKGTMLVKTTHNSDSVELYGTNGNGFKISIKELDNFISELEKADQNTIVMLEKDRFKVEIPGSRIPKAIHYLKMAKNIGVKLAEYKQIF